MAVGGHMRAAFLQKFSPRRFIFYTRRFIFKPNYKIIQKVKAQYSIEELEREVGVYSATPEFVRKHCGPIANAILDKVPDWYYKEARHLGLFPNIDVRIHRLYPGDYPAYPGWHCDGQYRETYFDQPDCDKTKVGYHLITSVSSEANCINNPEFLDEPYEFIETEPSNYEAAFWGKVHQSILSEKRKLKTTMINDGDLILFDSWTLHRVTPTKKRGWRLFFRMAMWYRPNLGDGGKLTKQEQVYKILEGSGW